ncbi:MAG TPA: tetratricopeptide repeat protein [Ktedonobacterales bacterium]|nr:tetratricopeptide repeat protein [Ktedonobacterales bacterium]
MPATGAYTFGELLRRYRRSRRLTQAELAERAGISADTISLLERGLTQTPQKATTELLSAALALAPSDAAAFALAAHHARRSAGVDTGDPDGAQAESTPESALPVPLTLLIGRERELATLIALLGRPHTRLLTLTGPAGVGKTRLALEVAALLRRAQEREVVWVNLISVQEPARVLPAIAQTLGVREQGGLSLRGTLIRALRDRRRVLLLDNFEQVLPAARDVLDLLIACPCLSALVTSRAPLNVRGERCFPVAPLTLPDLSRLPAAEDLRAIPSVALYLERVSDEWQTEPTANAESWRQVADICVQMDGLPLAIELAAARVRRLGLSQTHARLTQPGFLGALGEGAQDLPDHQRAMRSTIAWSYDLLGAEERRLFRWFGVFRGGAQIEAIEAVTGLADDELLTSLAALLDASLLQCDDREGARRYSQLVTLRAYAEEQLRAASEWEEARRRHAAYCLTQTDALLSQPPNESERQIARVDADYENVRTALGWSLEVGEITLGLRMVAALRHFWFVHSHYLEGLDWLERILARTPTPTTDEERALLAEAWTGVMALSHRLDQFERARDAGERALALWRAVGNTAKIAWALSNLSNPVAALRDYTRAVALCEECLRLQRDIGARADMVVPLHNLGELRFTLGEPRAALALYEESLALSREAGESDWARALTWNNIGEVYLFLDEPARVIAVSEPSYQLFTEKGDTFGAAICAFTLGRVLWRSGAAEAASAHLAEAERLFGALGNLVMVARIRCVRASLALERADLDTAQDDLAEAFEALAGQAREGVWIWQVIERVATFLRLRGETEQAARLYAAAVARHDATPGPLDPAERDLCERDLACLRATLTEPVLAACLAEGQALAPDVAITLARAAVASHDG